MKKNHCTVVVVRHGQSTHNIDKYYNSNPDHPQYKPSSLTQLGIDQVKETATHLLAHGINKETVHAAYVSPLPRTIQTADILMEMGIFSPDTLHIDNRLIEIQMGDHESRFYEKFREDPWDNSHANEYNGENDDDVKKRVLSLLNEIKHAYKDGYVLCITHGTPTAKLIYLYTGDETKLPTAGFKIL